MSEEQIPTPFHCELSERDGTVVVTAMGEIDLATAGEVALALAQARHLDARRIVLDLSLVTFLDSSGLRAILSADAQAREAGVVFEIVPGPRTVRRVFEIAGLDDYLRLR